MMLRRAGLGLLVGAVLMASSGALQAPESYNLTQIMDQFKSPSGHPSD